jgi:hypothetical protein
VVRRRTQRGTSRLGCLIWLLILAAIVYVGTRVADDVMAYYRYRDAMKQETRFAATRSDAEIIRRLRAFTDSVKLPLAARDVKVVRDENGIRIWAEYDAELKLPKYSRVFHLRPSAERSF